MSKNAELVPKPLGQYLLSQIPLDMTEKWLGSHRQMSKLET